MNNYGIYTLANDIVYNQLVALLNSIEVNISPDIPVCVIPYNNCLEKVKEEIKSRNNVTLFDNDKSLQRWDDFFEKVWSAHPRAKESRFNRPPWYQGFVHRKFAAFDGQFERFVFFDADSLAMKPIDDVLAKLTTYDLVFDDWEHAKKGKDTEVNVEAIASEIGLTETEISLQLHCDSFFGSKKGLFASEELNELEQKLRAEQVKGVRDRCWWSTSALFSYMTFVQAYSMFNFTLSSEAKDRTGNCADADPFINIDNVLYNQEGHKPIHRIHYMNYASADFNRLCQGEDVDIRYKDIFLHYRFLKQPEQKPTKFVKPNIATKASRKIKKVVNKLKRLSL